MASCPAISIIVPTWNNLAMLKLCIKSIARHSRLPHQVVVHVNQGSDGTRQWVRARGIEHTWTPRNVGICKAVNLAAYKCRAEYLVYLNDDMYVLPGWDVPLYQRLLPLADAEPCYVSGTMIQAAPISPRAIRADYGPSAERFREGRLLGDYRNRSLACDDWVGATWPPCCVHRKWWDQVGGYSEDMYPGFYSDLDFSMKLWRIGCRRFWGLGSSLVYHFGEKTTSLMRGPHNVNVKRARKMFLNKWGILPSTFRRHYLQAGKPYQNLLSEPNGVELALWERLRGLAVSVSPFHRRAA